MEVAPQLVRQNGFFEIPQEVLCVCVCVVGVVMMDK